jgi:ABC-2 type transport system ATP-binding protein
MSGGPTIELSGLAKHYGQGKDAVAAVDNLTLQVPQGQVLGLLGPNGAGKTTTIKMICGLISPSAGQVRVNGHDVVRQRSAAVRQIGAVLEGSRNVYWQMSAWQNLLYFGRLKGLRGRDIKPRAERLLAELGLWERRKDMVGTLSRGMQQKVAIAAALITDPPVILLDEPTIGLDVEAARTVRNWVIHLARDDGKTIVLTTHQLELAGELSDRTVVIRNGAVIADLPTADLLHRFREERFEVRVAGKLYAPAGTLPAGAWAETNSEFTRFILPDTDLTSLQGFLSVLRERNASLLSVKQLQPSMEEIFLRVVGAETTDA